MASKKKRKIVDGAEILERDFVRGNLKRAQKLIKAREDLDVASQIYRLRKVDMKCLNCGKEVGGKGKYCSGGCKQAAYRNRKERPTVTRGPATVTSVTAIPKNVTVTPTVTEQTNKTEDNRCRYCGLPADQASPQCSRH